MNFLLENQIDAGRFAEEFGDLHNDKEASEISEESSPSEDSPEPSVEPIKPVKQPL